MPKLTQSAQCQCNGRQFTTRRQIIRVQYSNSTIKWHLILKRDLLNGIWVDRVKKILSRRKLAIKGSLIPSRVLRLEVHAILSSLIPGANEVSEDPSTLEEFSYNSFFIFAIGTSRPDCYLVRVLLGLSVTWPECYFVRVLLCSSVTLFECYLVWALPGPSVTCSECYLLRVLLGRALINARVEMASRITCYTRYNQCLNARF